MRALRVVKDIIARPGVRAALVLAPAVVCLALGTGSARERSDCDGDRVVAGIEIDSDGIVIRAEVDDGRETGEIDVYIDDDFSGVITGGELRCLKRSGIFDIDECDEDDIVRFGKDIFIRSGKKVRGDVVAIGGSVYVEGRVYGDVVAVGGSVILDDGSSVRGDAVSVGGDVELLDGSHVRGDAVALGGSIEDEEGAHIGGDIVSMDFCLW
jgi:hypothetical protein